MTNTKEKLTPARALYSLITEKNAWAWESTLWSATRGEYENGHEFVIALMEGAGFEFDSSDPDWGLELEDANWLEEQLSNMYYDDLQYRDDYGNWR